MLTAAEEYVARNAVIEADRERGLRIRAFARARMQVEKAR